MGLAHGKLRATAINNFCTTVLDDYFHSIINGWDISSLPK